VQALKRLSEHPTPPGYPRYGYLLDCDGTTAGVILLIYSSIIIDGEITIRCSTSSWYVKPSLRGYAAMLNAHATTHKNVTYVNVTANPHARPILEIQGFSQYCSGRFLAAPALSKSSRCRVNAITSDRFDCGDLRSSEAELLLAHGRYGCISVICDSKAGRHPFVFLPFRKARVLPLAYLAYCRDVGDFTRCAGSLGRFLTARGYPFVVIDANGPIHGIIGNYSERSPKYFKGPDKPRLGDLAYSERVMFGF
jgi:hypothetical protein